VKKNSFLILIIFLLPFLKKFGGAIFSQNLDSLWKVYNNKNQSDTNRIKALQKIA